VDFPDMKSKKINSFGIFRIKLIFCVLVVLMLTVQPVFAGDPVLNPPPTISPAAISQKQEEAPVALEIADNSNTVFLPFIQNSSAVDHFLNINNRQQVVNYYFENYVNAPVPAINWDGNLQNCDPGTVDQNFLDSTLVRINFFRAMAGVPNHISFSEESNKKAQAAALMMSVNDALSHNPPSDWTCYSSLGAAGAGSSNLIIGAYGWVAIYYYMKDPGLGNEAVGHRRWVLYPQTQQMGSGDIPPQTGYAPTNALVVFDEHLWESRPATREEFVAWPPPGYVPYQIVYPRWSFSYAKADFSNAVVSMSSGGENLSVHQEPVKNGYGENTLVWIPNDLNDGSSWPNPGSDTSFSVNISNVKIDGNTRDFHYDVVIIDPDR
jgi:hypothetical protein